MSKKSDHEVEEIVKKAFPHLEVAKSSRPKKRRQTPNVDAQYPTGKALRTKYRKDVGAAGGAHPLADAGDTAEEANAADADVAAVEVIPPTDRVGDAGATAKRVVLVSKSKKKVIGMQG